MAIYNDRVFAYERMRALDAVLDNAESNQIESFINDDDRNQLAFLELDNYEKKGEFLYLHPILKNKSEENSLEILRRTNPGEFAKQMINAKKSIERYTSRINQKKYRDDAELNDWRMLIEGYTSKLLMMQKLFSK